MFNSTPPWILASWLSPSVIALILGLAGLRHWKKPALLLIGSALVQSGLLLGQHHFTDVADHLRQLFEITLEEAFEWASLLFSVAGPVPLALLLWAVFCQRGSAPVKEPANVRQVKTDRPPESLPGPNHSPGPQA